MDVYYELHSRTYLEACLIAPYPVRSMEATNIDFLFHLGVRMVRFGFRRLFSRNDLDLDNQIFHNKGRLFFVRNSPYSHEHLPAI